MLQADGYCQERGAVSRDGQKALYLRVRQDCGGKIPGIVPGVRVRGTLPAGEDDYTDV